MSGRKRGRPRKDYRIRVRAERRREIDYPKLARALLEQAAIEQHRRKNADTDENLTDAHEKSESS